MNYKTFSASYDAEFLLENNKKYCLEYNEIISIIKNASLDDVIKTYKEPKSKNLPPILNSWFEREMKKKNWTPQPVIYKELKRKRKLDFCKSKIGIEMSFNHRSDTILNLSRLNWAYKYTPTLYNVENKETNIEIGIIITFTKKLRLRDHSEYGLNRGGDRSATDFELYKDYFEDYRSNLKIPILIIALDI